MKIVITWRTNINNDAEMRRIGYGNHVNPKGERLGSSTE